MKLVFFFSVVNIILTNSKLAQYFLYGVVGLILILIILFNCTCYIKDTPIFDKLGSSHSFILLGAGCIVLLCYPFWVVAPNRAICTGKWSVLAWGLSMIVGINGIKMNFVLNQVRYMPRDRPERLANINSKSLLLSTFKVSMPIFVMTIILYLSNPIPKYQRIPNMVS